MGLVGRAVRRDRHRRALRARAPSQAAIAWSRSGARVRRRGVAGGRRRRHATDGRSRRLGGADRRDERELHDAAPRSARRGERAHRPPALRRGPRLEHEYVNGRDVIRALLPLVIATAIGGCASTPANVGPPDAQARGASQHVVAEGPVEALPAGTTFVSVLALPQPAGAVLGPHSHIPGFTYVLGGVATVAFVDGKTVDVVAGEAVFTPANVVHVHSNERGRGVAIALAVLLIGAVVGLVMLSRRGWRWTPLWLVGLITIGAIGVADPTMNDWYFIAVRPEAQRGGAMPVPAARRTHESAALADLGPGPFLERLDAFVIEPGGRTMAHRSDGAETLIVTDGRATICVGGAKTTVERDQALTVQANTPLQLLNVGTAPLGVVRFSVRPKSGQLETLVDSSPC
ncbi:MAG: cupin domain-containing protein [Chloroflexi bacterium]|nr:MAG: cupin domain-containing protein [Chloroflexota bacterium]